MPGEVLGNVVLLAVNVGTIDTPVWEPVASQRNVTFNESRDLVDVSSKDTDAQKNLPGRYSSTVTLQHLYIPGSGSYLKLRQAMREGSTIKVRRREFGADLEEADATLTNLTGEFPDMGAAVCSATLNVSGGWSPV